MKRKFLFLAATFAATVLLMMLQKPVFLAYYAVEASKAAFGEWLQVIRHGLLLDSTVAGYITVLPLLLTLLSLWVRIPERIGRRIVTGYFVVVAFLSALLSTRPS